MNKTKKWRPRFGALQITYPDGSEWIFTRSDYSFNVWRYRKQVHWVPFITRKLGETQFEIWINKAARPNGEGNRGPYNSYIYLAGPFDSFLAAETAYRLLGY